MLTNTYTDDYGVWPFVATVLVMVGVLVFSRTLAGLIVRHVTGPG